MTEIDLERCELGDEGVRHLSLLDNTNLTKLKLGKC